jgi:hypothetical protein
MSTPVQEYHDSCRPESIPLRGRWTFRLSNPGEILEVDVLAIPSGEWATQKEASDPTWGPIDFGELVVAIKTLC